MIILLEILPVGGNKFKQIHIKQKVKHTLITKHFIKQEAGWFVSLYSIHYVLYNVEDRQTDRAGVLTQVQFAPINLSCHTRARRDSLSEAVNWSSDHKQHRFFIELKSKTKIEHGPSLRIC